MSFETIPNAAELPSELPSDRPGHPAPVELAERRHALAEAIAGGFWRTDPPAQQITIANVRALRFDPPGAPRGRLLHFHGGAFRMGAPEAVATFAAALAERCGVMVVCPAYRLAPEHPFPAALIDGMAVIDALDDGSGLPLYLSGDSAGGGLAAGLAALAIAQERPIGGLILLSAWLDLTVTSDSYEENAVTDPLFSRAAASDAAGLYLQGVSARHPLASPLLGSVTDFPPTLISVGAGEVLAADGRRLHAKLRAAGVEATLSVVAGMDHVAVTRSLALTGAAETFAAIAQFIDDSLARDP
jgi:monoterpene epsilon-lactone hydrolase